jgi:hypothetical protein
MGQRLSLEHQNPEKKGGKKKIPHKYINNNKININQSQNF